jgi:hypothetical protein
MTEIFFRLIESENPPFSYSRQRWFVDGKERGRMEGWKDGRLRAWEPSKLDQNFEAVIDLGLQSLAAAVPVKDSNILTSLVPNKQSFYRRARRRGTKRLRVLLCR